MKTSITIAALALQRIAEAEALYNLGFYDAAFYIGGYSIELLLKAKVCKNLNIPDFFDDDARSSRKLATASQRGKPHDNLYKPFKVHDYEQLLILCGLFTEVQTKIIQDINFNTDWSIVTTWSEQARYDTGKSDRDVQLAITAFKNIGIWIQQFL